jgi:KaiC/GvpD/RAD55 family RecA-like ATPase
MIELKRTELLNELEQMSRSGSLLVIGGPGTGKSWLLRRFAAQRETAGDAVLLLLAEEHNYVESLRQLEDSLKTPAGIIATLRAYPGTQKVFDH